MALAESFIRRASPKKAHHKQEKGLPHGEKVPHKENKAPHVEKLRPLVR